jgi:hypothetical protein
VTAQPASKESASEGLLRPGRHARTEVDLDALTGAGRAEGRGPVPVELSLAAPFGALLSALLLERPFRLSKLALDYVAPDRLSSWATFSAKVNDVQAAGETTVSLLVFKGSRVVVRGQASVLVAAAPGALPDPTANGKGDLGHLNGERR